MAPKLNSTFTRHIKNVTGDKEVNRTKSVNITLSQDEYLKKHSINLSSLVREYLESLIKGKT